MPTGLCKETGRHWNYQHGGTGTIEFASWQSMIGRCYNPSNKKWHRYGGRGIKVCKRWIKSFPNFFKDMGKRPSIEYSIDRINNDGNYEPKNCRWATSKEQARNRIQNIIFNGECSKDASLRLGGEENLVSFRLRKGWNLKKAFTEPIFKPKHIYYNGEFHKDACKRLGAKPGTIYFRIEKGWSLKDAFNKPVSKLHSLATIKRQNASKAKH